MKKIDCAGRLIGENEPCYIIAEVGQAHEGSLGMAHSYIEAIAQTGVDAVKFQTHIAEEESSSYDQFRVNVFPQDKNRYDYWQRMQFTESEWKGLAEHARSLNIEFLSTPFSLRAVELLNDLNVPMWKIGSGDIAFQGLINAVADTKKPVLLSSGMSTWSELDSAIAILKEKETPYGLFQCTTSYPCEGKDIGYNVISEMKERYSCPVGLSDHSGTIFPSLASVALGCNLIEVHTVFSKECFGPDTKSSLTISELKQLVDGIRFIESGLKVEISKNVAADKREGTKVLFARSAFFKDNLKKGTVFSSEHVVMKKPGGMMSENDINTLIGRKVKADCLANQYIKESDFE